MTPAAFDTRRRYLGLSAEETPRLCGVQDRTIRRWHAGTSPIPQDAIDALNQLEKTMHEAVKQEIMLATDMVKKARSCFGATAHKRLKTKARTLAAYHGVPTRS